MKVITVTSEKGGTGKTTLATHLAAGLAARGKRVLLVDGDPQGHATLSLGLAKGPGLYNLLVRGVDMRYEVVMPAPGPETPPPTPPRKRRGELEERGYRSAEQAGGRLYVLPGNEESYAIPTLVNDAEALADALGEAAETLDVTIIDTGPTPGLVMSLIYMATDAIIVPTQVEYLSLEGMAATIARALTFKRKSIRLLGIVPNLYVRGTALHRENLKYLKEAAQERGWNVWGEIAARTAWREASQTKRLVTEMYPGSEAARECERIVEKVEEALRDG